MSAVLLLAGRSLEGNCLGTKGQTDHTRTGAAEVARALRTKARCIQSYDVT